MTIFVLIGLRQGPDRVGRYIPSFVWAIVPVPVVVEPCFAVVPLALEADLADWACGVFGVELFCCLAPAFRSDRPSDLTALVHQLTRRPKVVIDYAVHLAVLHRR